MGTASLADKLVSVLSSDLPNGVVSINVAGRGFINFKLAEAWLYDALNEVLVRGVDNYARHDFGAGQRVLIEFISANPTGDIHVGNGWWGSYGDALGRLLKRCGYGVVREYYVNDTGGQIRRLGESLLALKQGLPVPEDGYHGDYVVDLAAQYPNETSLNADPLDALARSQAITEAGRWAAEQILVSIKKTLDKLGIEFDSWFSQASIEESGAVQEMIDELDVKGLIYNASETAQAGPGGERSKARTKIAEPDEVPGSAASGKNGVKVEEQLGQATYLKSTAFGDTRDRVLAKSDGDFTYFAGDLAYHRNKLVVRGFDHAIDIFGADHVGHVPSLMSGVQALGIAKERIEVRLGQMVSLVDGGQEVQMSKRSGKFVTLSSLIDEIGPGAVRFLSLTSSINQATTLDLKTARSQTSENPVHYVRYAYARIAQIRHRAEGKVVRMPFGQVDFTLLKHPSELALLQSLAELPYVVQIACLERTPHLVTNWLRSTAGQFHSFYHDCYVLGDDIPPSLTQSRLWLIEATRIGLTIGLSLLGVTAPEKMFHGSTSTDT